MHTFFTIGHSNRALPEFLTILRSAGVGIVVDVRKMPRSRANPQFNRESLPESLAVSQLRYEYVPELGGLRGRSKAAASPNTFWQNRSFRNYADYAQTEEFAHGLARLRALGAEAPCAIMCAEVLWWRCHRRIIADYLIEAGDAVVHILGADRVEPARKTPAARRLPSGAIVYR